MNWRGAWWVSLLIVWTATAAAQPAPTTAKSSPSAATVLANVQRYYAKPTRLTAAFRQVVTNATFNTKKMSDGNLYVLKPSSFRFDYLVKKGTATSVSKSFLFDGATFWYVDHGNRQIVQHLTQSDVLPAAISFLTGGKALQTDFHVSLNTSGTYGGSNATVLELTPKQASAQLKQLFFVVDPSDFHVTETIVVATNGDTNAFTFYTPNMKATLPSSTFKLNPNSMPKYRVVNVQSGQGAGSASGSGTGSAAVP